MTSDRVDEDVITQTRSIPVGSRALSARRFAPRDTRERQSGRGLLFVHGLDSGQTGYYDRARIAVRHLGAVCLTFDLGGHGGSDGSLQWLTPRDHLADVAAAYDLLAQDDLVDEVRIGLCGASYGAYLAAFLTLERQVARLLLRAPGLYNDQELDWSLATPRKSHPVDDASEIMRRLRHYSRDVLVLESQFDEVIPHAVIDAYLSALPNAQHAVIPGARHALDEEATRASFRSFIIDFFRKL
jgi:uncharacterized protein